MLQTARGMSHSLKRLARSPATTTAAVATLALGIGVTLGVFAVIDAVYLRPLPVSHAARLVKITEQGRDAAFGTAVWRHISAYQPALASVAAFAADRMSVAYDSQARFVDVTYCSASFFETLGVRSFRGSLFRSDAAAELEPRQVVISHRLWRALDGARDVVGRGLTIAGGKFRIVGVTEPGFFGTEVGRFTDVYLPLSARDLGLSAMAGGLDESSRWMHLIGRLHENQDAVAAAARLRDWQPHLRAATIPSDRPSSAHLTRPLDLADASTGISRLRDRYRRSLSFLLAGVSLLLFLACVNVAALYLSVFADREHEIRTRRALGASRARLVGELLSESVSVSLIGGAFGAVLAWWIVRFVTPFLNTSLDRGIAIHLPIALDWRIVVGTVVMALLSGVLVGVGPAVYYSSPARTSLGSAERSGASRGRSRLLGGLVAAQVAVSLVLVAAAGLAVHSFARVVSRNLAVSVEGVLVASVEGPVYQQSPTSTVTRVNDLLDRIEALPGVEAVSVSTLTPLSGYIMLASVDVPGFNPVDPRDRNIATNRVTPGFLTVFGTRLRTGRDFNSRDANGSPPVAIVNSALANHYFAGGDALGRLIRLRDRDVEIVGVVETGRYMAVTESTMHMAYVPWAQWVGASAMPIRLGIRAKDTETIRGAVVRAIRQFDSKLSVQFRTLADEVETSTNRERLLAALGGVIAILALTIAAVGAHATTGYLVRRRRSELAVRMALGADGRSLFALVARQGALVIGTGIVLAIPMTVVVGRSMKTVLYDISGTDPAAMSGAIIAVVLVAVLSMAGPARKAFHTDPAKGLREDG